MAAHRVTWHPHRYNGFWMFGVLVKYNPMFKDLWLVGDVGKVGGALCIKLGSMKYSKPVR